MSAPVKYRARVVAKRQVDIVGVAGKIIHVLRITYEVSGFPPRTVWIDLEKAKPEAVKQLIKSDLERLLGKTIELEVEGI
jgi:hypothetical protein